MAMFQLIRPFHDGGREFQDIWFLYPLDIYQMLLFIIFIIIIFANIRTTIHAFCSFFADKNPGYSKEFMMVRNFPKLIIEFLSFCLVVFFVFAICLVYMLWFDFFLDPYDKFFQSATYDKFFQSATDPRQALITNWAQVFFITVPVFVFLSVAYSISSVLFVSVIINKKLSIQGFVWEVWGNKRAISFLFLLMINPMLIVIFVAAQFFWGFIMPSSWAEFLLLYPITHFLINFFSVMISFIFLRIIIHFNKSLLV
jgi:hypothetical protein